MAYPPKTRRCCGLLCCIVAAHLVLMFAGEVAATPESRAAALFLLISPSSRANGMGQAGVALADEPGAYYNPAAPALAARHHFVGATLYRDPVPWLPSLTHELEYTYSAFQVGWDSGAWSRRFGSGPASAGRYSVSAAFALYRTKLDLGRMTRTDERGNIVGYTRFYDSADNYTFSVGAHLLMDLGVGVTLKKIESIQAARGAGIERGPGDGSATAYDIGMLARLPLLDLLGHCVGDELKTIHGLRPVLDVSTGIAWNNRGGDMSYDEAPSEPLPANRTTGWAATVGVEWQVEQWRLGLVELAYATQIYTPQIAGDEYGSSVDDEGRGYEVSFLETLEIRRGTFDDDDGDRHYDTEGVTIKSDGMAKWFFGYPQMTSDDWFSRLARHVSISWTKLGRDSLGMGGGNVVQITARL